MLGLSRANLRHVGRLFLQGSRPAVAVYESLGAEFFLAPAPGWLNLGLWEGEGDEEEAALAPRRLVERLSEPLPGDAEILDVANGLGAQEPVIAREARPRRLVAVNLTEYQLRRGRERLAEAGAVAVVGDAVRLPFPDDSFDGLICVEAAFHFSSRANFLAEARRVLRPGGVVSMSDVTAEDLPRTLGDAVAGLTQLRLWGMRLRQMASVAQVADLVAGAGFVDVDVEVCGDRTIDPAVRLARRRLEHAEEVPVAHLWAARIGIGQVERLRTAGLVEYVMISARLPTP